MQQLKHCLNFKKMLHLPQLLENTTFIKISHPVAPWEAINIKTQTPLAKKKKKKLQHAEGSYAENAMATHSSSLVWKIPWTEKPGRLHSMGSLRVGPDWATSLSLFIFMHWRRKWHPLRCSCLENPRDRRAWWAAVYGVAQSQTPLKWLSRRLIWFLTFLSYEVFFSEVC